MSAGAATLLRMAARGLRVSYLGNFSVPYCTEVHVAASLEAIGVEVDRIQEGQPVADVTSRVVDALPDLFLWTQTLSLAEQGGTNEDRHVMVSMIRDSQTPSAGFHLDRWWGLSREGQVADQAFFRLDHVFTADGGHDADWREAGVNHHWLPPGVFHGEAIDSAPRRRYASDIAFVGSWRHYGHEEWWPYRRELIERLSARYGARFQCWPRTRAVRGWELNTLYASVRIVVGDSCLVGTPRNYWSDRVPETIGRGGVLVHPHVEGIDEWHPYLPTWRIGEWDALFSVVDDLLANDGARELLRKVGSEDVRENHTYRNRMQSMLGVLGLEP